MRSLLHLERAYQAQSTIDIVAPDVRKVCAVMAGQCREARLVILEALALGEQGTPDALHEARGMLERLAGRDDQPARALVGYWREGE